MAHLDLEALVTTWINGPNSEASAYFSREAHIHYPPAVLHWLRSTTGCARPVPCGPPEPDPDLYLQPTPMLLQDWAISYARAARSRDAACGAVRSFYRWLETQDDDRGRPLVPAGTHKTLRLREGRFARGVPGRELLDPDSCRHLAQAADRYRGRSPERARAIVYLLLNRYLFGDHDDAHVIRPHQLRDMRLTGRHQEHGRITWELPQKNASSSATASQTIHPDAAALIDEYVASGARKLPLDGSDPGVVFTTVKQGGPLSRMDVLRIVQSVAATHPALAELGPLSPDAVAHSPATPLPDEPPDS
ncbi:hypothetical protein [Streptomyces alboflavus]|uniref:hypothetical protein n=1 Tax=Streptomyces alboflavus TaxID=67267 RepID=UPI0036C89D78